VLSGGVEQSRLADMMSQTAAVPGRNQTVTVPPPTDQAIRYYRSGNVLWAADTALSILIPALILFTGFSARLRTLARRIGRRWFPAIAIYAVLFALVTACLTLPLTYYEGYVREHAYHLSSQSLSKWWGDWLKGTAAGAVGFSLVLWIPYFLLTRSPRRWWLYSALATIPVTTLLLIVTPLWIDPLFNHFGPMHDKQLESRILALAERAGISGGRVYQVDKSVDTKTVNAYVTGVGSTKRIVLWDTILAKLNPDQILFVTAHEMGHFVLRHTLATIVGATLLAIVSLYLIHRVSGKLILRFSRQFGFTELSDVASFPLFLLVGGVASFIFLPAVLAFSRHLEHEADRFALEITRNNYAAATTFVRLQQENLSVPRPSRLYVFFRGSHPPLGERADFANRYQPWLNGEPLRYARFFH
jgi:STE24 endopeptidase